MKILYTSLFFLLSLNSNAQTKIKTTTKAEHRLNISYTPQWFPNAAPIKHEGTDYNIGQVLYPQKNMMGHNFGIEYQFTGKEGLILSLGLQSGVQNHSVYSNYNLGYVNEKYTNLFTDTTYSGKAKYIKVQAMVGYRWKTPFKFASAWNIETKAGMSLKTYRDVVHDMYKGTVVEYTSPTSVLVTPANYETLTWGSAPPYARRLNYTWDFYVGISRKVNLSFIRSFSVGIEGTHALFGGSSGSVTAQLFKLNPNTGLRESYAYYTYAPKDFALGLKMVIGLGYWKE